MRKVHPLEAPEVVRRFNILTVPSTVVVDGERRVRAVNFGFADAEALAGTIRELWADRGALAAMRHGARATYEARYTGERNLELLERIYRRAMERSHGR